jgi:5-methylcytosine-specific restriction endonuclease McrA
MSKTDATYNKLYYEKSKESFVCDWCGEVFVANKYNQARKEWNACSKSCGQHLKGELRRKPHMKVGDVEHKQCSTCGEWMVLEEFYTSEDKWDGLSYQCKCCSAVTLKKYRQSDKGKLSRRRDNIARRALEAKVGKLSIEVIREVYDENVDRYGELTCVYCENVCAEDWHLDHRVPLSRGGDNEKKNLAISCPDCNLRKWTKTDVEFLKIA